MSVSVWLNLGSATTTKENKLDSLNNLMSNDLRQWIRLVEDAWHGSPHKFEKFSMSEIGNGEGNQDEAYLIFIVIDNNNCLL